MWRINQKCRRADSNRQRMAYESNALRRAYTTSKYSLFVIITLFYPDLAVVKFQYPTLMHFINKLIL